MKKLVLFLAFSAFFAIGLSAQVDPKSKPAPAATTTPTAKPAATSTVHGGNATATQAPASTNATTSPAGSTATAGTTQPKKASARKGRMPKGTAKVAPAQKAQVTPSTPR